MRAAIFNPYLDTLGGGERYTVGVILAYLKNGYKVDLQWENSDILSKLEKRFGIELPNVKTVESIDRGDGYDSCFWVSDGSVPTLRSRKNILHFQVPFKNVNGKTLINRMKFFRIKHVVCNSLFTKEIIDKEYGTTSVVLYPPVSVKEFRPRRKQNVVTYVGRFSKLAQKKRQDVLIEVFKRFYVNNQNWKLVLAGGSEVGKGGYVSELKQKAKGYPIEIWESPSYTQIKDLLGEAKMFWSASGYGVDEGKNPQMLEHFGITVVEAMAAKAVPLVLNKGGHKEIIKNGENGILWNNKKELLSNARNLSDDPSLLSQLARGAQEKSVEFSEYKFIEKYSSLIN